MKKCIIDRYTGNPLGLGISKKVYTSYGFFYILLLRRIVVYSIPNIGVHWRTGE